MNNKIESDKFNIAKYLFEKIELLQNNIKIELLENVDDNILDDNIFLEGEIVNFIIKKECKTFDIINIIILNLPFIRYSNLLQKNLKIIFDENINISTFYKTISFHINGLVSFHEKEHIHIIDGNNTFLYKFYSGRPFRNLYNIYLSSSMDKKIIINYCKKVKNSFVFQLSSINQKCKKIGYTNIYNEYDDLIEFDRIEKICTNINCNCFIDVKTITGDKLLECNIFKNNIITNVNEYELKIEKINYSTFYEKYFNN